MYFLIVDSVIVLLIIFRADLLLASVLSLLRMAVVILALVQSADPYVGGNRRAEAIWRII